jgi:hypothetical protein
MPEKDKFIVITSINSERPAFLKYADLEDWTVIVVGDRKGPYRINDNRIVLLDIDRQKDLGFSYTGHCPENHYSRKNIGYLYAMKNGAKIIAETDDDNIPKNNWGLNISFLDKELEVFKGTRFFNVYKEFTSSFVWPRGFPLENVLENQKADSSIIKKNIGIWQFLADDDPDVDAIYRLTVGKTVKFDRSRAREMALDKHVYCPFNSQNTFWTRATFPFMYLPISVPFRFTDILRGYIAQRLMWEDDLLLGFGDATVVQERNEHNLMGDFSDEIAMYVGVRRIIEAFEGITLKEDRYDRLFQVYMLLLDLHVIRQDELDAVSMWIRDLKDISGAHSELK